jgi:hypothetical protein
VSLQVIMLQHYQGERLRAPDLRDEYDELTTFRSLHIRSLHDAWGIALGLEVYLIAGTTFAVSPGLAYDRLGRELPLPTAQTTPDFTGAAGDGVYQLVLTLSNAGQPLLRWLTAAETRLGVDVPLLALTLSGGNVTLDFTIRRFAQPLSRPHIAYGLTAAEQRWKIWSKGGGERRVGFGIRVDTKSAGFVTAPLYVAKLQQSANTLFVGQPNVGQVQMYVFTSIANATTTGFTFRVVFAGLVPAARAGARPPQDLRNIYQRFLGGNLPFRVAWMGVEPIEPCAPSGLEGVV